MRIALAARVTCHEGMVMPAKTITRREEHHLSMDSKAGQAHHQTRSTLCETDQGRARRTYHAGVWRSAAPRALPHLPRTVSR